MGESTVPAKVLIVDDNEENRYMLETLFRTSGYRVSTATNGKLALERLRGEMFDLIVSDILMPEMDGFRLIRECKGDPLLRDIPFIFYTATYTEKKDVEFGLSLGAARYYIKPEEPDIIVRQIAEVLRESTAVTEQNDGRVLDERGYALEYTHRVGAKLDKKTRELKETEQKYRELFDNVNDAVFIHEISIDKKPGRIIEVNLAACEVLGYTREELLGRPMTDIISEEHLPKMNGISTTIRQTGSAFFLGVHRRKDGSVIPVEVRTHIFTFQNRQVAIVSARDITRRKAAEDEANLANRKLALMTDVTYQDIQNKVTALRGYIRISRDIPNGTIKKEFSDKEEQVLVDIHNLIKKTKEYQQMGEKGVQWLSLENTIRSQASSISWERPVTIDTDITGLQLLADPLIERVFQKLLENTVSHGKTVTTIHITCHETPDALVVVFEDNGIGVPVGEKERIFDRVVGGKGHFGLFFVREILDLSHMVIKETGEPGKGARFEITVPKEEYRFNGA